MMLYLSVLIWERTNVGVVEVEVEVVDGGTNALQDWAMKSIAMKRMSCLVVDDMVLDVVGFEFDL